MILIFFFVFTLGKVKILEYIHSNKDFTITTALLGESERLPFSIKEVLERMVFVLYMAIDEVSVNNVRQMLFSKSKIHHHLSLFHQHNMLCVYILTE